MVIVEDGVSGWKGKVLWFVWRIQWKERAWKNVRRVECGGIITRGKNSYTNSKKKDKNKIRNKEIMRKKTGKKRKHKYI